jgi:hypothetical protein
MNGTDVYIFRDAGWNLAAYGSFQSAALLYMRDLTPRLFSHYTPAMPLLFAGYASVFPRNAYAGTVFNLLLGLLAAAVSLRWVLRLAAAENKLRYAVALAIATLPVVFIAYDRPEAIALVLFTATVALSSKPTPRPAPIGLSIAGTFLAHPFAAVAAATWAAALLLAHAWNQPRRWLLALRQIAAAGASALAALFLVALLYYTLDRDSLARFVGHALGIHSGIGVVTASGSHKSFFEAIHHAIFGAGRQQAWAYMLSLFSILLLAGWFIFHRKKLSQREWLPIAAGLVCAFISVSLFSIQGNYMTFLAFAVPLGLIVVSRPGGNLAAPGLALLLFAAFIHLPDIGIELFQGVERLPSYRAARLQPAYLLSQLPSHEAIVAVEGGSYDLFKPKFHRMIELDNVEDANRYAEVAAVANCYGSSHLDDGEVLALPVKLDAADFHLIQAAPEHLWITLFGHRIMRKQWGYGCDLYLRNGLPRSADNSQF